MKALIGKLIVAGIAVAVLYFAYSLWKQSQDQGPGPGFARGNGRLEATEIDISTKLAGRVTEIRVEEGDFVKTGQILAVMQTDTLEAQLLEAKAEVQKSHNSRSERSSANRCQAKRYQCQQSYRRPARKPTRPDATPIAPL